jgi:DNA-binding XRE family transcriptional regulator
MTPVKPGSKYHALYRHLREHGGPTVRLTFREIEAVLRAPLPSSARAGRAFWSNRAQGALQASSWMDAGYRVSRIDLPTQTVTFVRSRPRYSVRREQGRVLWDPELIRALRGHLGLNQAGLADVLGVRQQTVSEWERGTYAPTRASGNHLTLVAERAGFDLRKGKP